MDVILSLTQQLYSHAVKDNYARSRLLLELLRLFYCHIAWAVLLTALATKRLPLKLESDEIRVITV